ncbi:hypothetical protein J3F84DRAFT_141031 [Trichoderma pleuroticola]
MLNLHGPKIAGIRTSYVLPLWHQLGTYVTSIAYDPLPDANVEPAQPQLASEHVGSGGPLLCKCIDTSWRMGYHWDCAFLAHARAHTNKSILACQAWSYRGRCLRTWDAVTRTHTQTGTNKVRKSSPSSPFFFPACARGSTIKGREGIKSHIGRVRDTYSYISVAADNMRCTGSRQPSLSLSASSLSWSVCCEQSPKGPFTRPRISVDSTSNPVSSWAGDSLVSSGPAAAMARRKT